MTDFLENLYVYNDYLSFIDSRRLHIVITELTLLLQEGKALISNSQFVTLVN